MFCSFDMLNPSIPLLSGSIATPHDQIYSEGPGLKQSFINNKLINLLSF